MVQNIVATISQLLTPDIVGKIAATAGFDRTLAQKAVSAVVPTILGGLADLAAKPGGARQISDAVADQPFDPENIVSNLNASPQVADKCSSLLSSLLGGGTFDMLASTLSRYLGIGDGTIRRLMGLLTPVIMGVLGREQRAAGLDVNGLAHMLTGQKEQIAAAMPAGLGQLLAASGEAARAASSSQWRSEASPRAANDPGASAPRERFRSTGTSTQGVNWLYLVLPLIALGALLWYLLPDGRTTVDGERTAQVDTTAPSVPRTTSQPIYLTSAPGTWTSVGTAANDYVNQDVYNRAGEKLGTIKDMLNGADGRFAAAVINVGQFLGIGEKVVGVPYAALQLEQRNGGWRVVMDATKDALQAAPAFETRTTPRQ